MAIWPTGDVPISTPLSFPTANQLVIAMHHQRHRGPSSPLVQWAQQLHGLYSPECAESSDEKRLVQIDEAIQAIDRWVMQNAPRSFGGARFAQQTVGAAIAKLARTDIYAWAQGCARTRTGAPELAVWERHAQLVQALDDLLACVRSGHQHLPLYLPEIDRMELQ